MKLPELSIGDIVEVVWDDAVGDSSWFSKKDFEWPEMRCHTVGYFFKANKKAIALVDSLFKDYHKDDGTCGGYCVIPLGMVVRVRKL